MKGEKLLENIGVALSQCEEIDSGTKVAVMMILEANLKDKDVVSSILLARLDAHRKKFPTYESVYKLWKRELPNSPNELHLTTLTQLNNSILEWKDEFDRLMEELRK